MKTFIALAACAVALSGCALGLPGVGNGPALDPNAFLNNPNCSHHDSIDTTVGAGGVPASVVIKASRDCLPANGVAIGAIVGQATNSPNGTTTTIVTPAPVVIHPAPTVTTTPNS